MKYTTTTLLFYEVHSTLMRLELNNCIIMQCIFIDFTAFLAKSNVFEKVFLSLMKIMSFFIFRYGFSISKFCFVVYPLWQAGVQSIWCPPFPGFWNEIWLATAVIFWTQAFVGSAVSFHMALFKITPLHFVWKPFDSNPQHQFPPTQWMRGAPRCTNKLWELGQQNIFRRRQIFYLDLLKQDSPMPCLPSIIELDKNAICQGFQTHFAFHFSCLSL